MIDRECSFCHSMMYKEKEGVYRCMSCGHRTKIEMKVRE